MWLLCAACGNSMKLSGDKRDRACLHSTILARRVWNSASRDIQVARQQTNSNVRANRFARGPEFRIRLHEYYLLPNVGGDGVVEVWKMEIDRGLCSWRKSMSLADVDWLERGHGISYRSSQPQHAAPFKHIHRLLPSILILFSKPDMESADLYKLVQSRYGELAERSSTADQNRPEESVAKAFGYDASDLAAIPQDANLGVGCGNPLATANIRDVSVCSMARISRLT